MTVSELNHTEEDLPDNEVAKEFYAKYEMQQVLGRGVSSTVRKCIHKLTKIEYAAKIIDLTNEKGREVEIQEIKECTKKEIAILQLCSSHPNIINLVDTFETSSFLFLVFELCTRGELFDYLTEVVTLSEKRTRVIMNQLLDAVAYIHDENIVHRDLKPENILLDNNLNVKLSDFGFATWVKSEHDLTDLCGTPGYLAPEVLKVSMFEGEIGYGRPCDMWACGVILYTLLSGCPPFWHRKQMMMLRSIMEGNYSMDGPVWADISEPPKDLIRKLLVVDPEHRLTAREALQHPFFSKIEEVSRELRKSIMAFRRLTASLAGTTAIGIPQVKTLAVKTFNGKFVFRSSVYAVIGMIRLRSLYLHPPAISAEVIRKDAYTIKMFRKIIDNGAFKVYGHWVKRGENQNRAALFENAPKRDLKASADNQDDSR